VRILYAFLCDHASEGTDERMDVHGVFRRLYAPSFPAQHQATLVAAVEWDNDERGDQPFRIDLLDPSRSPVMTASGHTTVPETREAGMPPPMTRFMLPIEQMMFAQPGRYEFELHLGEERFEVAPLHLIEDPEAGEG
jgi:hypothetical protein